MTTPVYLEAGSAKTFACSLEWPGWCRAAKAQAARIAAIVGGAWTVLDQVVANAPLALLVLVSRARVERYAARRLRCRCVCAGRTA